MSPEFPGFGVYEPRDFTNNAHGAYSGGQIPTMSKNASPDNKRFATALSRHGYGFQYAVLNAVHEFASTRRSFPWFRVVSEFPVAVAQASTKIDFILQHRDRSVFLTCECKRVNPAFCDWFFARAPFVRRGGNIDHLVAECVRYNPIEEFRASGSRFDTISHKPYHIAIEVKSGQKGDPIGGSGKAIEQAATQVCTGLNGFVEYFRSNSHDPRQQELDFTIIPVIFTTARLFTTSDNIGKASLATGEIELNDVSETPWLLYQYHLSPDLKHGAQHILHPKELGKVLEGEFIRTIAVVSSAGIESFLGPRGLEIQLDDPTRLEC